MAITKRNVNVKLTIETIKKLIKEELTMLESEYGEEFNPQMELPAGHKGDKTRSWKGSTLGYSMVLNYNDDKNKAIYYSYVKKLIQHPWTIDMIIEAAAERIKDFFYEMIEGMEMENIVNSYIFRNLYKGFN